jgi:transcriptional regulator with XRE-family HTH domain
MARLIVQARARKGISQHELARLAKVARITIANIELGKHTNIRSSTAYKLEKALELTSGALSPDGPQQMAQPQSPENEAFEAFVDIKRGTAVEPTGSEQKWLLNMLANWGAAPAPTTASVLFLLLARRHGQK